VGSIYKKNDKSSGFTLVEVLVIIAVIAILVTFTIIAVGDWRKSTAETEVKNDLTSLSGAMESARNFSTGYPLSIPNTFTANSNVTVTYISGTTATYCIQAVSKVVTSVTYHIDSSQNKDPQTGPC
jgi:prepilin-type N-terminal cleavage/methylation domain-containing protein